MPQEKPEKPGMTRRKFLDAIIAAGMATAAGKPIARTVAAIPDAVGAVGPISVVSPKPTIAECADMFHELHMSIQGLDELHIQDAKTQLTDFF